MQPEPELARVLNNIKETEKTLRTFSASFSQVKTSHLLREALNSEGFIYFDVRGKMLIKVTHPSPLLLLFTRNAIIVQYPGSYGVESNVFGNADNIFQDYLGLGESVEALKNKYDIRLNGSAPSGGYLLKMMPKINTTLKHIELIDVVVSPKNWLPEQIHFKEKQGDDTTLRLHFISINEPLPRDIFAIELPEDDKR